MNSEEILEIIRDGGGILLVLMTIVQISPLKINPWSWLAKKIGNAFNQDTIKKLNEIEFKQREIEEKLDRHIYKNQEDVMLQNRQLILRFAREILSGEQHTKEEFVEVLAIIDAYENYCIDNPKFPNNRCLMAIELIKKSYRERLDVAAGFLGEK